MRERTTVAAFVAGLAGVFGAALGIGTAVGPVGTPSTAHTGDHMTTDYSPSSSHGGHGGTDPVVRTSEVPGGLLVSRDGYTLDLHDDTADPGRDRLLELSVTGPDGTPVTDYRSEHEKELHLIVVRRDFTGFQHVHPERDAEGTWSAPVDLRPGQWRVFADFAPLGGDALTLGADLFVPGAVAVEPASRPTRTAVVDGYTVTLDGTLDPGTESDLTLTVSEGGSPVADLEPYLGAYGHLVALREGDLAYLHVHPDGAPGDGRTRPGPEVVFHAAVPSPGRYHLYLDFKHDGVVRTAVFTLGTGDGSPAPPMPRGTTDRAADEHDDDHGD